MSITKDVKEIFQLIMDKHPDDMVQEELKEGYVNMMILITGMIIGSKISTDKIKTLLKEYDKKKEVHYEHRQENERVDGSQENP